jgi:hypothetical protein
MSERVVRNASVRMAREKFDEDSWMARSGKSGTAILSARRLGMNTSRPCTGASDFDHVRWIWRVVALAQEDRHTSLLRNGARSTEHYVRDRQVFPDDCDQQGIRGIV